MRIDRKHGSRMGLAAVAVGLALLLAGCDEDDAGPVKPVDAAAGMGGTVFKGTRRLRSAATNAWGFVDPGWGWGRGPTTEHDHASVREQPRDTPEWVLSGWCDLRGCLRLLQQQVRTGDGRAAKDLR